MWITTKNVLMKTVEKYFQNSLFRFLINLKVKDSTAAVVAGDNRGYLTGPNAYSDSSQTFKCSYSHLNL